MTLEEFYKTNGWKRIIERIPFCASDINKIKADIESLSASKTEPKHTGSVSCIDACLCPTCTAARVNAIIEDTKKYGIKPTARSSYVVDETKPVKKNYRSLDAKYKNWSDCLFAFGLNDPKVWSGEYVCPFILAIFCPDTKLCKFHGNLDNDTPVWTAETATQELIDNGIEPATAKNTAEQLEHLSDVQPDVVKKMAAALGMSAEDKAKRAAEIKKGTCKKCSRHQKDTRKSECVHEYGD